MVMIVTDTSSSTSDTRAREPDAADGEQRREAAQHDRQGDVPADAARRNAEQDEELVEVLHGAAEGAGRDAPASRSPV
ncbi:hypothetical protein ACRAWC_23830 [Leifsonia sp. L25]|uniref:hypothetical protein n=1 Tax=Leifsonia sp. L25 TaxID=3423957 RepID=UPI003D69D1C1